MNILVYKKTIVAYILLCALSFSGFFIALTPTKILIDTFVGHKQPHQWDISNEQGNIWQGRLLLSHQQTFKIHVHWTVNLLRAFINQPIIQITLKNQHSHLHIESHFNGLSPVFHATGQLDAHAISQQLPLPNQAGMTGTITIKQLRIANKAPYYVTAGKLLWGGGSVYANNNKNTLPPLDINITRSQHLNITVHEHDTPLKLISIQAQENKQANITISQRLLTLTQQGMLSEHADEVVIRFTETLTF